MRGRTQYKIRQGQDRLSFWVKQMGSGNYGTGKNGKLRRELMAVLMGRYGNISSAINHQEAVWPEEELSGRALCILDALADLTRSKPLSEVVGTLEICGILSRKEALHFLGTGRAQKAIKEATGLLQSPSLPLSRIPLPRKVPFHPFAYCRILAVALNTQQTPPIVRPQDVGMIRAETPT